MKRIRRIIVKHPKGKSTPKTIAGMFLERAEEFESVLMIAIKKHQNDNEDGYYIDWSDLEFSDLCYYRTVLDHEIDRLMSR